MRMRFGIYIKAAGTAAVRIATVPVALFINRISCGFSIIDEPVFRVDQQDFAVHCFHSIRSTSIRWKTVSSPDS